jgi:hypothetical protein
LCRAFPGQFDRHSFARETTAVVLGAYRQLQALQRAELQLQELQGAQLSSLLFNINRDQKKAKATSYRDWCFFAAEEQVDQSDALPAVVAHVCLSLRHEGKLPPLLVAIWRDVIRQAKGSAAMPEVRALATAERSVVLVAPVWEGQHLRSFLAAKGHSGGELVELQDLDRPLLRYRFKLPERLMPVHFEAGVLLLNQEPSGQRLLGAT